MNWGKGIIIGMGAFMTFIIILGVNMFKQAPNDFDPKYYEKGLAFDTTYAKEKRVYADKAQPLFKLLSDSLQFTFTAPSEGSARFERPDDKDLDRSVSFKTNAANTMKIAAGNFEKGRWDLTLDWESHGKKYLIRRSLYLQ